MMNNLTESIRDQDIRDFDEMYENGHLIDYDNTIIQSVIFTEDVKEFIKRLKEMIKFELKPVPLGMSISERLNSQINILAGEELK